jgi:hypothetical protein
MQTRRIFLRQTALLTGSAALVSVPSFAPADAPADFRSLFDGKTLRGWTPKPRAAKGDGANHSGRWAIEDGIIVGGQEPPGSGLGGYLVSDEAFGDFELLIDARPDWPADTGVYVRATPDGRTAFQVLLDHRPHGGIGGYYGNGLGRFHAGSYGFTAEKDKDGRVTRLIPEPSNEASIGHVSIPLDFSAPAEVFLRVWKPGDWNQFRIRSVGALPLLTTWINGEKISELDTAKIQCPGYEPEKVLQTLGRRGHISLEVHSSGGSDVLGNDRWAPDAVCRWRNIFIKALPAP